MTDGQGRVLAVADSSGARTNDNGNTGIARWSLAGGTSAGHSFNADRQSGGDVPELSNQRVRRMRSLAGEVLA